MTWENRFTFEVSSAAPDAAPVWVDFTSRIRDNVAAMDLRIGRQTNLDGSSPSVLTLLLDNVDDALTYGNTSSPYPWWAPGLRCRLRETIAGVVMDRFTGFTQVPEETLAAAGLEQKVSLTAVDRLGDLQGGLTFTSTLAAHILGSARPGALKGYWPLLDASTPFANQAPGASSAAASVNLAAGTGYPTTRQPRVTPNGGTRIAGDDGTPALLQPGVSGAVTAGSSIYVSADLSNVTLAAPTLSAGQVATAVIWANLDLTYDDLITILEITTNDGVVDLRRQTNASGGTFRITKPVGTLTGAVNSTVVVGSSVYYICAIRYGYTPNLLEMWVNDQVYTAALAGALAGPDLVASIFTAAYGSIAHMQLYVGDANAFTYADFLLQRQVGLLGLERQSTGDRIRTIAQYAGIPNSEIANTIDAGTSVMQRASLAGKTRLDAMREAEVTEQGLLYVDGSGNLCFADRRTIYNT